MKVVKEKWYLLILLVMCGMSYLSHLETALPTIMEARNFISAREMLESGDWLVPTLNGEIRIRKPPLPVWLTTASIALAKSPNDLFALRFPAAIMGTMMVFFLYGLIKEIFNNPSIAFYSAAVLATSYMVIEQSRTGAWDIYCNSFMLGGLWMFYRAYKLDSIKFFLFSGLLFGFSFLSKGPVSFYAMMLPFLAAFFITGGSLKSTTKKGLGLCLLLTIILSMAWPAYLYLTIPDIATTIANEESSAWINRHNRPFWFYLHFPLFMGAWAVVLLYSFVHLKNLTTSYNKRNVLFFLIWFVTSLVLLSIVPEKKERYFLPALPPLAVLVGLLIDYHSNLINFQTAKRKHLFLMIFQGIAMITLCVLSIFYALHEGDKTGNIVLSSVLFFFVIIIWIISLLKKQYTYIYPITFFTVAIFCFTTWHHIPSLKFNNPLFRDLREVKNIQGIGEKPIYSYTNLGPEQLWGIGSRVIFLSENEYVPKNNAVIITNRPLEGKTETIYPFHFHPGTSKHVLYINVME